MNINKDRYSNITKQEVENRIQVLQVSLQSFGESFNSIFYIINGILVDKLPLDPTETKRRLTFEIRNIINEEIERLQVLAENKIDMSLMDEGEDPPSFKYDFDPTTPIDIIAAVEFTLGFIYESEFNKKSGISAHPDGISFKEWLHRRKLTLT